MTRRKHSLWLHYSLSAIIVLGALLTVAWYATDRFEDFFLRHLEDTLESRAITINESITHNNISAQSCRLLKQSDPSIRVTLIDMQGTVQCDSHADAATMENHAQRPEVRESLTGKRGTVTRFSNTVQATMLYLAIPRQAGEQLSGITRTAIPLRSIDDLLAELYTQFLILLLILLAVVSAAIILTYRKINQPLATIIEEANHFSHGDFDSRLPVYEIKEIDELGTALNNMAEQLTRLENLRQDFVANVSHELKTPIATIKGYVETLLDGAQHDPQDLDRFLKIVLKQNDRLGAIVDDLLTLSRLETAPVNQLLELHEHDACDLLQASADICQAHADTKHITIQQHCESPIPVEVDYSLMTQALVNLLDNAIKYSNDNTTITLSVEATTSHIKLTVSDMGPGIAEEHIPRLFERFYRVDKSRSRRIGGTGLGLAIVKHIAHIHGGQVEVKNNGGAGCSFSITLAKAES